MLELVEEQKIPIPRSLMRVALSMMRRSVKKRAGFNIDEVAPIDQIHTSFIPCLFGESIQDVMSFCSAAKWGKMTTICVCCTALHAEYCALPSTTCSAIVVIVHGCCNVRSAFTIATVL